MTEKPKWVLIGRGKAGWHALARSTSGSGGNLEPYTYWTGEKCAGYAAEAEEGALVYDAQDADTERFIELVVSGPMPSADIGPEDVHKFGERDKQALALMLPALGGEFKTIGALAAAGLTSLDYVGVAIYERLLRQVPGVRFGRVRGGATVWEG